MAVSNVCGPCHVCNPSAGLALPGSGCASIAHLQTHSGLTLVEQEWPQSRLEASAPSPGPCSLCTCSKSSLLFCQGHEDGQQLLCAPDERVKAPTAHAGSDSSWLHPSSFGYSSTAHASLGKA